MLSWFVLLVILLLGIGLVVAEVIFVPGTTFVGVLGLAMLVVGVFLGFSWFGETVGWFVFAGSLLGSGLAVFYGLRNNTWNRFSLDSEINSRVNEEFPVPVLVGALGHTVSALRPQGRAEFGDQILEVRTLGDFLPTGTQVRVSRIEGTIIIVESIEVYKA